MWLDKLRSLKATSGMTNDQIVQKSGVPKPTVEKIFSGATKEPKITTIQLIVHSMGFSLDDIDESARGITPNEASILRKYRALDERGREAIDQLLDTEYKYSLQSNTVELFPVRDYYQPASAGYGDFVDDDSFDVVDLRKRPPTGTTYLIHVNGDSMEPTYHDGERLFVSARETLRYGDIGVFVINGDLYVKEYGPEGLVSHNAGYPTIVPGQYDVVTTLGKVLGICTDDYISGE